jgi:hypothetical protein
MRSHFLRKHINDGMFIEDLQMLEQITQWPKEKVQKDKQRSTKHTYKSKDRVTRTPLKPGGELGCCGRVSSSCSIVETSKQNTQFIIRTIRINALTIIRMVCL